MGKADRVMNNRKVLKRGWFGSSISYVYLIILTIFSVFPLLWILLSSVKSKGEITKYPTEILPRQFTLDYYKTVLGQLKFTENIANSLVVALCTTIIATVISVTTYPFSFFNFIKFPSFI